MRVFISWSGDSSKALAESLRNWLPSVIQAIKPYFSPDDISKGSRWSTDIAKELEECKMGLLCLTAENLEAPWIMFEAGALSKSLTVARVCPLLFGIEPADIKGPLVQFQAASFTKVEMKKSIKMMNQELGSSALSSEVLDSVFEMWWPRLDEKVKEIMSSFKKPKTHTVRSERDILEEILARVRAPHAALMRSDINPVAVKDLLENYEKLVAKFLLIPQVVDDELSDIITNLQFPINHIIRRSCAENEVSPVGRDWIEHLRKRSKQPYGQQQDLPDAVLTNEKLVKGDPAKK